MKQRESGPARDIDTDDYEARYGHKGCVVWLTGLSASGKSTVATHVARRLFEEGSHVYVLDGDALRQGLTRDLGFSPAAREENIRRAGEVAKLFRRAGFIVLAAFVSPYRKDRDFVRSILDDGRFLEVYVKADLDTCIARDPKGLYQKALRGLIPEFTGVSAPYEPPLAPELVLDTVSLSVDQSVQIVLDLLRARGIRAART